MLPYLIAGTAAISFVGGMYTGGFWNEAGHNIEKIAEQKEEIRIDDAQDKVTAAADTKAVEENVKIVTVFKDRIKYITKEVPVEVVKEMDSRCVVPNHFVSLWNSANQGTVPDPSSAVDVTPSGVELSDISYQKEQESEICITNTKRLKGLQEWVREELKIYNK